MKWSFSKHTLINIVYPLFVLILIIEFVKSIFNGFAKESWNITEFLINYQGGFVRRGLLGEIILYAHHSIGISPYVLILSISILAYIMLVWFFVSSFAKKGYTLFILPFVFFLGNPILNDFWVRKDALIMLLFISIIYFSTKKSNLYLILVNILFIIGLLIHEVIGFFCFPILLLLLIARKNNSLTSAIALSVTQLIPSILTFFSVLYFKGSQLIASQIWKSWKPIAFPIQAKDDQQIPTAIDGISWSLKKGLLFTYNTLIDFSDGIYAPLGWFIILLSIYYVLINTTKLNFNIIKYVPSKNFNRANISNIMLFQLLALLPIFILGYDYGRWIFYWITSSFAIILLVPEKKLAAIFPKIIFSTSTKINRFSDLFLGKNGVLLCCILIGFTTCTNVIGLYMEKSLFIIIVKFISNILYEIVSLIRAII